jgi:Major Facilitator Superfamily
VSSTQAEAIAPQPSFIRTRIGVLTLLLLCGVQFLDVVDSSITNVAFPSIQRALHFSQQNLQWVASGYLLTYGGFLLLGGRLADLLGRRRILVAGLGVFAVCSLAAGLAQTEGVLIAARVLQGVGAAMMAPAALSILTTTFREGRDRNTALGAWGAISGLAVMSPSLAALVLCAAWLALGSVVTLALMVRAGRVTGWRWWRVFRAEPEESLEDLERARTDAEETVRATLARLAPAMTIEIASASVAVAGDAAGDVVDVGSDILSDRWSRRSRRSSPAAASSIKCETSSSRQAASVSGRPQRSYGGATRPRPTPAWAIEALAAIDALAAIEALADRAPPEKTATTR